MVQLAVIFLILVAITPFVTFYLLGKYRKLREDFDNARTAQSSEAANLRREIAELKKQLASVITTVPTPSATGAKQGEQAVRPAPVPVKEVTAPPSRVDFPPTVQVPPVATQPLQKAPTPPAPPAPTEPSGLPAAAKPPADVKAPVPAAPQKAPPPVAPVAPPIAAKPPAPPTQPPSPQAPAPRVPPASSHPAGDMPSTLAARISTPLPVSAFKVSAPKDSAPRPTLQQRLNTVSSIEETLGTNWLYKLGIIILVVGVALFGIHELGTLGPLGKAAISYFTALFLLLGGIALEKNERYKLIGRGGIGGGWALLFFTTYAIYYVEAMRVFPNDLQWLTVDCVLMLLVAVVMALHTLRYRSQFVTGLAFLLGYFTVALSQNSVYSLSAGVFIALGLVSIVLKMGWFELEVFGILSTYLTHLYWLYRLLGVNGAQGRAFPEYHASLTILFFYWLTFRFSYVKRSIKSDFEEHVSTAAAVLNMMLLLGCLKFQSVDPTLAYIALFAVGAVEFICAQLPATKRRREAFIVLTVAGAALMLAAVPSHYTDNHIAILWLVGTEVFLIAGSMVKEVVFRRLGLLTGLLVGIRLIGFDFRDLVSLRLHAEKLELSAGILFAFCAVVFYLNDLAIGTRWKEFFDSSLDRPFLNVHSYLGAFSAGTAAWALFTRDWTAIAFAALMLVLAAIGRALESRHLQVQYTLLALLAFFRAIAVNLHFEAPEHTHVYLRLLTLPILGAMFYATAKFAAHRDEVEQRTLRGFFAATGTALFALLIWYEVPELWQPLAFIAFAVILSEAARALTHHAIGWHSHILGGLAIYTAFVADPYSAHKWHTIPWHALAALPVVAGLYWLAKRVGVVNPRHLSAAQVAYSWAGTGVMTWILEEALHAPWIAVGWIIFAVALTLSNRWIRYSQLAWQANVVGFCALLRAFFYNYDISQNFCGPISLRVFTITLVAAGLYFLSRQAAPSENLKRATAFFHSFAATGLLSLLAWYEYPNGWLAPIWAAFALVLAIVDQRLEFEELPWQSHALALMTFMRALSVNLYVTATWRGLSVRLLSLAIVGVIFYALSRVIRMPEEWRRRDLHHTYSWAASVIVSLLLWYELQPLSIAVGWAVFGLVLFEYGILRKITQFRYQAYVALIAAFARIFFANLTAGEPGEFWGPRVYTILPLVLILYFVYAQLPQKEESLTRDRRLHFDVLVAYLGTAAVVALFYFQFPIEWVVTSWAAVVFVLLGASLALEKPIFLHQGLLLTLAVFGRGMAHNLFGASYFGESDWKGDYLVLGSAAGILLASLVFAFRLRGRSETNPNSSRLARIARAAFRRPEQLVFFVPVILVTFMLALKMKTGMITVSWGIEAVLVFLFALALKERSFRLTGLGLLLLCVGKIAVLDFWGLQVRDRYVTLIVVGIALTFVSFLYTRYRDTIRQYL
jgi:Predicted membrane protein (DUF2339)